MLKWIARARLIDAHDGKSTARSLRRVSCGEESCGQIVWLYLECRGKGNFVESAKDTPNERNATI